MRCGAVQEHLTLAREKAQLQQDNARLALQVCPHARTHARMHALARAEVFWCVLYVACRLIACTHALAPTRLPRAAPSCKGRRSNAHPCMRYATRDVRHAAQSVRGPPTSREGGWVERCGYT